MNALKEKDGYLAYDYKETENIYRRKDWTTDSAESRKDEKYVITGKKMKPKYEDVTCMIFHACTAKLMQSNISPGFLVA